MQKLQPGMEIFNRK